jgi:hypothetical protein
LSRPGGRPAPKIANCMDSQRATVRKAPAVAVIAPGRAPRERRCARHPSPVQVPR